MTGELNKLNAAKVAKCTDPGYLLDGGNLYLQITPRAKPAAKGSKAPPAALVTKSWTFRYRDRTTGKLRELGLGPYPDVTLEEARLKAAYQRVLLREGKDPIAERKAQRTAAKAAAARTITFDQACAAFISSRKAEWKSAKHADQWVNTLATYASPFIGSVPVADIDLPMVRRVLDPIWTEKYPTAKRVRGRLETVLNWATVSGYREGENPARFRGFLDHLLPNPTKIEEHHPAMPYAKVPAFIASLKDQEGVAARALEFTILTAARTGEVIGARWEEFDLEGRIWTIPAARMKAGKEHIVPLSRRALAIIKGLLKTKEGLFVFPGGKAKAPLSNMAMLATLRRMNLSGVTVHGFRSSFRDWAGEATEHPREVIEHALAHQLKDKAEAAYHRSTLPEKRRKLMEDWASYCAQGGRAPKARRKRP